MSASSADFQFFEQGSDRFRPVADAPADSDERKFSAIPPINNRSQRSVTQLGYVTIP